MAPTIQIFGLKKCSDTNKALRFFKERGIPTQFVDLSEKAMSRGELESVSRHVPLEDLLDRDGKQFKARSLQYMAEVDIESELLADPLLLKTPITRFGKLAACGHTPAVWKEWAETVKNTK